MRDTRNVVFINEINLPNLSVTYRLTDKKHSPRVALNPEHRSEAFYVWDRSSLLRVYVTSSPMHPSDWTWEGAVWQAHAPLDHILQAAGYEETAQRCGACGGEMAQWDGEDVCPDLGCGWRPYAEDEEAA